MTRKLFKLWQGYYTEYKTCRAVLRAELGNYAGAMLHRAVGGIYEEDNGKAEFYLDCLKLGRQNMDKAATKCRDFLLEHQDEFHEEDFGFFWKDLMGSEDFLMEETGNCKWLKIEEEV